MISKTIVSQEILQPSATETLLILEVLNPNDSPYENKIVKLIDENKNEFKSTTNSKGELKVLVPNGHSYFTKCGELKNERIINIGSRGYSTFSSKRYTYRFTEFTLQFINYQNKPVTGEEILTLLASGDSLIKKTDSYGKAKFYLPIKESFDVRTKYNLIKKFEIPDKGYQSVAFDFRYRGQSTKEYEDAVIQNKLAMIEYAKQNRIRDSIQRHNDSVQSTKPTMVIFFASDREFKHLGEISVFDGGKKGKLLGTVNSVWSCHSGPSEEHAEVKFKKMKGSYTYYAVSTQGYEWEGSYNIKGGGWESVILEIEDGKKRLD
ncbi:MAG: hypothetical protein P8I02_04885 [Flavobacteriales bacterium]|nr:hypothetical protein [Flavobacteriales bacterium]